MEAFVFLGPSSRQSTGQSGGDIEGPCGYILGLLVGAEEGGMGGGGGMTASSLHKKPLCGKKGKTRGGKTPSISLRETVDVVKNCLGDAGDHTEAELSWGGCN